MNNLDVLMGTINKKYGSTIITKGTNMIYVDRIPFSSPHLNYLLYGGLPVGKAVEFFGGEGSGKTTTALDAVKNAQHKATNEYNDTINDLTEQIAKLKESNSKQASKDITKLEKRLVEVQEQGIRSVLYVDAEQTLDEDWATKLGVDLNSLYLVRPQTETAEQILQIILDCVATGDICMAVLDSVPMLIPQQLMEETLEKKAYGGIALPLARFSGEAPALLTKNKCTLIMINQMRDDLANPYNKYKTPGGRAVKHLYAVRLFFRKGKFFDKDTAELANNKADEPCGNFVNVEVVKTKICKPDRRTGMYTLNYETGIDVAADILELALNYNIINQRGSWFDIIDISTGEYLKDADDNDARVQGRIPLLELLRTNKDIYNKINAQINKIIVGQQGEE